MDPPHTREGGHCSCGGNFVDSEAESDSGESPPETRARLQGLVLTMCKHIQYCVCLRELASIKPLYHLPKPVATRVASSRLLANNST